MARDENLAELRRQRIQLLIDQKFGGKNSDFALAIGRSPAQVGHWLSRHRNPNGDTCRHIETMAGLPRDWLDQDPDAIPNLDDPRIPEVSHPLRHWPEQTPTLTREEIRVREPKGKFLLELWDNALGMRLPAGTVVKFDADRAPKIGDGVLILDATGNFYVRKMHESLTHAWEAAPVSGDYVRINPTMNGARVIAVFCGVDATLDQLIG